MSTNEILEALIIKRDLDKAEIIKLFDSILDQSLNQAQIAAALVLLRAKGLSSAELTNIAKLVLEKAVKFKRPDYLFGDIVGTGGDLKNTLNISTLASLVCAASGLPMAKHGSVSVSSQCGSADLLRELGVNINLQPDQARTQLDKSAWTFLFAANYHLSFQVVKPVRKDLGLKTVFNLLGPLVNPSAPPLMLIGVYEPALISLFAETLKSLGLKKALIVHGSGLDEIAVHGPTQAALLENNHIDYITIQPEDLGLQTYNISDLVGGTPQDNALVSHKILAGQGSEAHNGAIAASAGAMLWLGDLAPSWAAGVSQALQVIKSGQAEKLLLSLKERP